MKRLAIISTHPIQYYAPLFILLAKEKNTDIKVFYTWGEQSVSKYDPSFKRNIQWDIPLLMNYNYEFLQNIAPEPGSHHFKGISNPNAILKISEYQPDAILVFGWSYQSHLKIIRYFSGKIPVWFRGDSTLLDNQFNLSNLIKYFFLNWLYSHIDKAFYVGTNNKKYFQKYGVSSDKLVFSPHAIDNTRFTTDRSDEAKTLRAQLKIPNEHILILFAGKFEEKKDPILLLEAFIDLNATNTHLLFVGNGELEGKLKALTNTNPTNRIHFLDFQNQNMMPVIYQACNLFCLPSKGPGETWGLAVNEAMCCSKAIIVSDKVGCAIDLVKKNHTGDIFKAGEKDDLIEKLRDLCYIDKLETLGKQARETISNWSLEITVKSLIKELTNETKR